MKSDLCPYKPTLFRTVFMTDKQKPEASDWQLRVDQKIGADALFLGEFDGRHEARLP
ncbi:MAG: hypothetical protein ACI9MC_000827 [Kiritimatiellia bacterium]